MTLIRVKTSVAVVFTFLVVSGQESPSQATSHKPTLAQIEAAKQAELANKRIADEALKKLARAKGDLKQLNIIANKAQQKYLAAKQDLLVATRELNLANKIYLSAVAEVSATNREIGKLAAHAFMNGSGLTDLESILSSSGPQELIDNLSMLENLGVGNKTSLKRFKAAQDIAQEAKAVAEIAHQKQTEVTARVAATKKEADDAKAEQQKEVDKLQAVQDKLQKELASAKRVRITLEQKRQLAILEETRANEATKVSGQSKIWRTGGPTGAQNSRTTEAQRLKAVEFAKRQVLAKKPYVWGDEGPNAFYCSGLVYAAYKYAGFGWPNWDRLNSGLYYTYTKQIPISEMQPGDIIFYSYEGTQKTIHHMSIYAGNGMMWEARSTATGLKYSSIYSVPGMMPYAVRV